jgi:S-adenosylmethionine hydrolase
MLTLSSDFRSPYPAAMRGVIRQWTDAELLDVTHDLPRQDVRASAFWLRELLPYFPPAVHLAVIDPGVGTDRDAVVVRAGEHALVGPDNGVLVPVARRLAAELSVFRVETRPGEEATGTDRRTWPPATASATFHGRDVFAPAAAKVHVVGADALERTDGFEAVDDYETVEFPDPTLAADGATGEILAVDDFGNAITNIPGEHVADRFGTRVAVDGERAPLERTYAAVGPGERLVTVGSHGNVELAVNQGRGDDAFGVATGGEVSLSF